MAGRARRTIGDYFELCRGNTYKSALLEQAGPVLLGLGSIQRNGGFRSDSLKTYGGESPDRLLVQPGELYLSLKDVTQSGDLLGAVARLPMNQPIGRLTQDTVKLKPVGNNVPLSYLYWLLRTPQYRSYCRSHATGTTNLGLAREDFLSFPAPEPTQQQSHLAEMLDALEDKFELNRRMNETLESIARAMFKSWFVNFDPVRAKMSGEPPESVCQRLGLTPDLLALFPDRLVDSELGEIPEGWEVQSFADTVEVIGGGTPKTSVAEYWNGDIPWFSVVDAPNPSDIWVVDTEKMITQQGVENSAVKILPVGTTIISARGTVGKIALVGVPMAMNQSCYGLKAKTGEGLFNYFSTQRMVAVLQQHTHGSVFDTITRATLEGVETVSPTSGLVDKFEELVRPYLSTIKTNIQQSGTLATLRDSLLPRLLFGELRVPTVEEAVA
ncbi:MAG: restriction endonuclease subunit S [Sideroxydans sp.]|nr:restriction endonuclease subunit S [Sideroxydans sp.]